MAFDFGPTAPSRNRSSKNVYDSPGPGGNFNAGSAFTPKFGGNFNASNTFKSPNNFASSIGPSPDAMQGMFGAKPVLPGRTIGNTMQPGSLGIKAPMGMPGAGIMLPTPSGMEGGFGGSGAGIFGNYGGGQPSASTQAIPIPDYMQGRPFGDLSALPGPMGDRYRAGQVQTLGGGRNRGMFAF